MKLITNVAHARVGESLPRWGVLFFPRDCSAGARARERVRGHWCLDLGAFARLGLFLGSGNCCRDAAWEFHFTPLRRLRWFGRGFELAWRRGPRLSWEGLRRWQERRCIRAYEDSIPPVIVRADLTCYSILDEDILDEDLLPPEIQPW